MAEINKKNDQPRDINEEMKRAFIDYSMSVIMSRALPDIRDGLKPVHRRILHAMNEMGMGYEKSYKKSARIVGECFVKDTLVLTEQGLIPIQDVKKGDTVYTQDGLENVKELYIMPKRDLIKIILENGLDAVVTKSQKFKVLTQDWKFIWKEARELTENDYIVIKSDYPDIKNQIKVGEKILNKNIAYLLGQLISDGWVEKSQRLGFYSNSLSIIKRIEGILQEEFKYFPTVEQIEYEYETSNGLILLNKGFQIRINSKTINQYLIQEYHLLDIKAENKKIPKQIFLSPKDVIFSFISGLIDGDGSIHKERNVIHYGTVSKELANQLMILLHHFDIHGFKYLEKTKTGGIVDGRTIARTLPFFSLEFRGECAQKLGIELNLAEKEKAKKIKELLNYKVGKSNFEILPYGSKRIFSELSDRHVGGGWYQDIEGKKIRSAIKHPSGVKIRYSKELFDKPLRISQILEWGIQNKIKKIGSDLYEFIERIITDKIYFLKVSDIEEAGTEITYDLQVENKHEFIANGMLAHNCLGKYHPHGDQAVYDSLVRMAQDFSLRYPLIAGQGNFGSVDGDSAAAMRYTETKMAKITKLMLQDIEKETVEWRDNFDGTLKEPEVLPAILPNLLINGSSGIAVGMATNMAPHNICEVIDGTIRMIDAPETSTAELMEIIKGPDFPTGGIICGRGGILSAYSTGRGSLVVRAKTSIEEGEQKNKIIVHELPYQVNKSVLLQTIAELVKEKKLEGISDLRDESDRKGMRIVIELKRDAIDDVVLNQLFEHTELQSSFGVLNLAIVKGEPKVLMLKEILQHYIEYRIEIITRRTTYDLKKAKEKMHILEGLMIALRNIDEVIKIIRQSKEVEEAKNGLMKRFKLSEIQAKAILDMRLQKLTGMEIEAVETEYKETKQLIENLEALLADKQKILAEIKRELLDIKERFGDPRRTQIVEGDAGIDIEDLIPVQEVVVTITKDGYIKRIPTETYRTQHRGGKGLIGVRPKEEDFVVDSFITSTHDYLMFFTNHGRVYWMKAYKIPEGDRYAKGKAIINLLPRLEEGEKVETAVPIHEFDEKHYLIFSTKKGTIKKTVLSAYGNIRVNGIIAIKLEEDDELMGVELSDGTKTVMIATAGGQACRFNEKELRPMGRATHGVIGIRLKNKKDSIVAMTMVDITGSLFTLTENGFGKRSPIDEYRMTHRGSKGVRTIVTNERNGNVVFVSQVSDENELIITTEHGMTVRIPVRDIREQGRNTMGVRIMRLNEGDKVVSVTITKILIENGTEEASEAMNQIPIGMGEEKQTQKEPQTPIIEPKEPPQEVKKQEPPAPTPKEQEKTMPPPKKKTMRLKPKKEKHVPVKKIKKTQPKKIKPVKKQKKTKAKPKKKVKTVQQKKGKAKSVKKQKKSKPVKKAIKVKKPQKKKTPGKKKSKKK